MVVVTLVPPPGPVFELQADTTSGVATRITTRMNRRSLGSLASDRTATRPIMFLSEYRSNLEAPQKATVLQSIVRVR